MTWQWHTLVLLVLYLYLLVRQQHIKRLGAFRIGLLGILAVFVGQFVAAAWETSLGSVVPIVEAGGGLVAFVAAVVACSPPAPEKAGTDT